MACGKPIIASLNGEGARVVEESAAGIAAPAGQPEALADAIIAMMDAGADQLATNSANAYGSFEANYSPARVYDGLECALKEAAGKKAKARS